MLLLSKLMLSATKMMLSAQVDHAPVWDPTAPLASSCFSSTVQKPAGSSGEVQEIEKDWEFLFNLLKSSALQSGWLPYFSSDSHISESDSQRPHENMTRQWSMVQPPSPVWFSHFKRWWFDFFPVGAVWPGRGFLQREVPAGPDHQQVRGGGPGVLHQVICRSP